MSQSTIGPWAIEPAEAGAGPAVRSIAALSAPLQVGATESRNSEAPEVIGGPVTVVHGPQRQRLGRHRPGEQEALQLIAAHPDQDVALGLGLDPSATTRRCSAWARLMTASTIARASGLSTMSATNEASIFASAAGSRRRYDRLAWPTPKSSIDHMQSRRGACAQTNGG